MIEMRFSSMVVSVLNTIKHDRHARMTIQRSSQWNIQEATQSESEKIYLKMAHMELIQGDVKSFMFNPTHCADLRLIEFDKINQMAGSSASCLVEVSYVHTCCLRLSYWASWFDLCPRTFQNNANYKLDEVFK